MDSPSNTGTVVSNAMRSLAASGAASRMAAAIIGNKQITDPHEAMAIYREMHRLVTQEHSILPSAHAKTEH